MRNLKNGLALGVTAFALCTPAVGLLPQFDSLAQAVGTAAQPSKPAKKSVKKTTEVVHRGQEISTRSLKAAVSVAALSQKAEKLNGQDVVLKGRVKKVCQKKGCWFTITDSQSGKSTPVRITSKGYLFFVPFDTAGFDAVVSGTFRVKEMSVEEAKHMAQDEAGPGVEVPTPKGPVKEYRLEAVGVRLSPTSKT